MNDCISPKEDDKQIISEIKQLQNSIGETSMMLDTLCCRLQGVLSPTPESSRDIDPKTDPPILCPPLILCPIANILRCLSEGSIRNNMVINDILRNLEL